MALRDDWHNCDLVMRNIEEASSHCADVFKSNLLKILPSLRSKCESPIEAVFLFWWVSFQHLFDSAGMSDDGPYAWTLVPQQDVIMNGTVYRVDFEVVPRSSERAARLRDCGFEIPRMAVELDGHDFHERTKEQVAYRNTRDRLLQGAGWKVLHFSGSEVARDPSSCLHDLLDVVHRVWEAGLAHELRVSSPVASNSSKQD